MIRDYYSELGVSPDAEAVVITAAYRALAQRYHPDKHPENPQEAHRRMTAINEAYSIIGNKDLRRKYDDSKVRSFERTSNSGGSNSENNTSSDSPKQSKNEASHRSTLKQEELDRITVILNKRGVRVKLEDGPFRGRWSDGPDGPEVTINPFTGSLETLIKSVGCDVLNRSATESMRKSLIEAVDPSEYCRKLASNQIAKGASPGQAADFAREECLIDQFCKHLAVDKAEQASWWKAFAASTKYMRGKRLSPEDAIAWMHYATHEVLPLETKRDSSRVKVLRNL